MKILDILEQIQSVYNKRSSSNEFKMDKGERMHRKHDPSWNSPTSGAYGRVYPAGDPHLINKVNYHPEHENIDGYQQYMKYLIDSDIASSNPFAPRVYKMDAFEDKHGRIKYKVKLETLHRLDSVDEDLLDAIMDQLYTAENINLAYKTSHNKNVVNVLAKCVSMTAERAFVSKNEYLNQLCAAIKKLSIENNLDMDIHGNNIMFRYGKPPQLVIIDPLT